MHTSQIDPSYLTFKILSSVKETLVHGLFSVQISKLQNKKTEAVVMRIAASHSDLKTEVHF